MSEDIASYVVWPFVTDFREFHITLEDAKKSAFELHELGWSGVRICKGGIIIGLVADGRYFDCHWEAGK